MTRNRRSVEAYAVQAALYAHDYRRAAALLPRNAGTTLHEFVLERHAAAALTQRDEGDL